jgi:hypothetical protein
MADPADRLGGTIGGVRMLAYEPRETPTPDR